MFNFFVLCWLGRGAALRAGLSELSLLLGPFEFSFQCFAAWLSKFVEAASPLVAFLVPVSCCSVLSTALMPSPFSSFGNAHGSSSSF